MSSPTPRVRTCTNARLGVLARVLPAALIAHLAGAPVGIAQAQPEIRDPLSKNADVPGLSDGVSVDENLVVDLHVNDEDLSNVLQMLSIQSQRNIVTSKSVSATVTANLYSVTFYEALDAILHVNGYGYIEEGNFIYVYTLEELQEILEQNRQRAYKVIKLNYLNAVDAAEFVKPLLSEEGQIKTNGAVADFPNATLPFGADQFANEATMVVVDYPEIIEEIENLLAELDSRPAQILIESTILQSTLSEQNAFGVDFSIIGSLDFLDFAGGGGPLSVVDGLIGGSSTSLSGEVPAPPGNYGSALQSTPGNTSGPATFKGGIVSGDVAAFIRLLDEVSDTTILSRPNILTLNRQPARVLVGKKVGYLNTTSTDTATTQTVEFLDTGTQLYVRPFVSTEGTIRMELKPQVSEASIRDATDASGATVTIPDELTNEMIANVMVRDGQTVVLGGLFRDNTQLTRRQVPFAGDIPIIGAAFRGHDDSVDRSEIIFMIKPSIVSDEVLIDQGERAHGLIERVVAGTREGLLPWSRKKRSAQLLITANKLLEEGKYNQALHVVQRSLALNHSQAEAIAIRDKILNETTGNARILLDEIVYGELESLLDTVPSPDERSGSGNRLPGWTPDYDPSEPIERTDAYDPRKWDPYRFTSDDLQEDEQVGTVAPPSRTVTPDVEPTTQPDQVAEVKDDGPLSQADTKPADDTNPMANLARSSREQVEPNRADDQDWRSLQQDIRANAERRDGDATPANVERASGYRYAESEDAVGEVLDDVVGLGITAEPGAATSTNHTVTLKVRNASVQSVLKTIADATGKSVVASPSVDQTVSVDLKNATFEEAMQSVTYAGQLNTLHHGDVTYVYHLAEIDPADGTTPHWVWKAVQLEHVKASTLLAEARQLVSADGQAETDQNIPYDAPFDAQEFYGRSAVIVFDLLPNAEQLAWILQDIDAREGERVAQSRSQNAGLRAGDADNAVVGLRRAGAPDDQR